jgi:hypothetical protein
MTVAMYKQNRLTTPCRVDIVKYNSDNKYRLYVIPAFGGTYEEDGVYETFEDAEQALFKSDKVFGFTRII